MMMDQQAYVGESSIKELSLILQKISPLNIFLVRGKKSYELCGAKSIVESVLSKFDVLLTEFFDFEENPKIEDLERGLSMLNSSSSSVIIAIGGGSVLDMAKLIRFFYSYFGDPAGGIFEKHRNLIPLIAIPTTAGTGCEATHFAVLYKNKIKYSVESDEMLPDVAIVAPEFTYDNSEYLTACTGFDALSQAIEAYWNVNATKESDEYASKAIKLLLPTLSSAVKSPTKKNRDMISEGSYWAGRAINITKTTAPHAFSYPFTAHYGIPHGHAVALTFPLFYSINLRNQHVKNKLNRLYQEMGFLCADARFWEKYINEIGLNRRISVNSSVIINEVNLSRLSNNPVFLTQEDYDLIKLELGKCI